MESAYRIVDERQKPAVTREWAEPDDVLIMELAKRRLAEKRGLLMQVFDYAVLIAFSAMMASLSLYEDARVLAVMLCFCWGTRLAYRLIKFVKPAWRGIGFFRYLRERKERNLEWEYDRLKKLRREDFEA